MNATVSRGRTLAMATAMLLATAGWAAHHVQAAHDVWAHGQGHRYVALYAALYAMLLWQLGAAYLDRPVSVTAAEQATLDSLDVAVLVPAYNEDPDALEACLRSMLDQARMPQTIVVVDDGSADPYPRVRAWFFRAAANAGARPVWIRQPNAGKRHAQAAAVNATPTADVYWTVDSDTISDPHALDELLKPLTDRRVQSVAGIVMAANVHRSFLTRFTDLWLVSGQLTDRASLSVLGSVWVNSGPIAVYRAEVIRDNLDAYLGETFAGRPVPFSDDSMLTLFAMLRGRTVQQPSAFAFALMPERAGHFLRMFLRWMRGSFIRSLWRARYLPLTSVAYWLHLARWVTTVLSTTLFVAVVVVAPFRGLSWEMVGWLVAVPVAVGYAQTLRYMTIRRSDQSTWYQWGTWLLAPVAVGWAMVVLRAVRWYGAVTCWRTGWGTRKTVEVGLAAKT